MSNGDTRPPASDPIAIAKWHQEQAALQRRVENEQEFRTHVLVTLGQIDVKLEAMKDSLDDHIESDDDRFKTVTQKIGDGSVKLAWILGIGAGAIGISGVAMWIIGRATS